jgi:hypothetical protein
LAEVENPLVSFVAGSHVVEWAQNAIKAFHVQIDQWRDLPASPDGDWSRGTKPQ